MYEWQSPDSGGLTATSREQPVEKQHINAFVSASMVSVGYSTLTLTSRGASWLSLAPDGQANDTENWQHACDQDWRLLFLLQRVEGTSASHHLA
jgi:hypothetical protein